MKTDLATEADVKALQAEGCAKALWAQHHLSVSWLSERRLHFLPMLISVLKLTSDSFQNLIG